MEFILYDAEITKRELTSFMLHDAYSTFTPYKQRSIHKLGQASDIKTK